jgi:hypothetical protein
VNSTRKRSYSASERLKKTKRVQTSEAKINCSKLRFFKSLSVTALILSESINVLILMNRGSAWQLNKNFASD